MNRLTENELTLSEAARELAIPYPSIYNRWRLGRIPYERRHGLILVKLGDVVEAMQGYRKRGEVVPQQ